MLFGLRILYTHLLVFIGGSLELPMWLTEGFLVTFFGRWWGAVRIHMSHVQLPYTVHRTRWTHVWWWGQYTHTCVPTATVHGVPYTVNSRVVVGAIYAYMCTYSYRTWCTVHGVLTCGGGGNIHIHVYLQLPYTVHHTRWTHVWWWGQYTHTCVPTATVHGAPYTVYSHVVVGAIYTYMCTYSYRTRCTIHGVPCTVYSRVVVGAIYAYMCTYSYCTWCTVHGELTCGGGGQYTHTCVPTATVHGVPYTVNSCVEGAFTCGSYSRVQGTFTCGSYSCVRRATKVKFFTPWYCTNYLCYKNCKK